MRLIDNAVDNTYNKLEKLYNEGKLGEESVKKVLRNSMWNLYSTAFGISYNVWKKRNAKKSSR